MSGREVSCTLHPAVRGRMDGSVHAVDAAEVGRRSMTSFNDVTRPSQPFSQSAVMQALDQ